MLTDKQQRFVEEYLKDLNGTQAAIRAGYAPAAAHVQASRLLSLDKVQEAITKGTQQRSVRTQIDADTILREIHAIATADTNEVVQYRRNCCRYCWGIDFRYQRTAAERERELVELKEGEEFDEKGGIGFHKRRDPNPDCPECFGDGEGEVFVADTRTLSPAVRALYAGVKRTKEGLEVKLHSKDKHLELLGQHLGLFKHVHEHKGAVGVVDVAETVTKQQQEAIAREMLRVAGYEFDE